MKVKGLIKSLNCFNTIFYLYNEQKCINLFVVVYESKLFVEEKWLYKR